MYATATTGRLASQEDGSEVVLGGVIDSVRVSLTRKGRNKGQRWARFELSDLEGAVGGVIFVERAHGVLAGGLLIDLDEPAANRDTLVKLRDLCTDHHGERPVYVRIHTADQGAFSIRCGRAMCVEPSSQLYEAAIQLVGDGRVRFTPRNGGNGDNGGNGKRSRRRAARRA